MPRLPAEQFTAYSLAEGNLRAAAGQARGADSAVVAPRTVVLSLLGDEATLVPAGVSWGVPWLQGAVARGASFKLGAQGKELPVQTWPLATWPDGSLK